MNRKEEVLKALKDRGDYVSGQSLSDMLGVSRTAVWKMITALKKEGYMIESSTNRGYRLMETPAFDPFNRQEIEAQLHTGTIARNVFFLAETGSTNEDAARLSDEGAPHGTLVAAGMQKNGKGRRGRTWISPAGTNTYFSLLLRPDIPAASAPILTLVSAVAAAKAIGELLRESRDDEGSVPCEAGIKWPNDIVVRRVLDPDGGWKKVCGILTEMRLEDAQIKDIIIGTGINVNADTVPEEITSSAASLKMMTGSRHPFDRAKLTASVMDNFEPLYERFITEPSMRPFRDEYESLLVSRDRRVRVLDPAGEYEGLAVGIDDLGALKVIPDSAPDGLPVLISSGEVSVRGVEGYI
ncbi:MAG: biotin--[Lachnospiraceae bacterium]|nr:biotin--[acetyl-CoA-carboxylase] ligase [Lachnospiraceae bacterium]